MRFIPQKHVIRLNNEKLEEKMQCLNWNKSKLVRKMGISNTTLWRTKLPIDDPRYNVPGNEFIAQALSVIPGAKFEELFFLEPVLRERNNGKELL